ncbi:Gfo/Idh/MocA family protein [Mycobacterium sp. 852002-51613_SCH5001154]|uniref:Gfo/Idh/MocA family protein n=1 Tax=Mycobacterium sp. 852002-51613_SCH5001154 TaxID=1834104 RepID=UPI0018D283D2|nr:Gfo/Idh/MocA family oxidoreductase [Mycobacterium sp. 852002-51613_SCH5001154]
MHDVELIEESKNFAVVARQRPDGVLIATPSVTHARIAIPFIEAGVPTFIEKPMATTVDDAIRIHEAVVASGAPVVVGHVHLYNPAFQAAENLLADVAPMRAVFWEGMNHHPRADSSVLWDWLPHGLSMARALFGANPISVQARGVGGASGFQAAIARFVIAGVPFIGSVSWMSPRKRHRMTILGEENSLTFDDTAERKLSVSVSGRTSFPTYGKEPPLTRELRTFIDVVRTGKPDTTGLEDEVAIVRAIAAAEESAQNTGRLVAIKLST